MFPTICVVAVAELLARFGSKLGELAVAVLLMEVLLPEPASTAGAITIPHSPLFDPLRGDPRFPDLLRREVLAE